MYVDFQPIIKDRLIDIWNRYADCENCGPLCEIAPQSVDKAPKNALLFIGLNPSLRKEDEAQARAEDNRKVSWYYKDNIAPADRFFGSFHKLAQQTGMEWGHVDLLFMRKTEQTDIGKLAYTERGAGFVWDQLQISKEMIEAAKPKVIVVANTLSRRLLGHEKDKKTGEHKWLDMKPKWRDDWGTYEMLGVPTFFTSMLSGKGRMDKESVKRLAWHINFVKGK